MWICLIRSTYEGPCLPEVCTYYGVQFENVDQETGEIFETTWQQLVNGTLTPDAGFKLPRGPYTIESVEVLFINIDVDFTDPMGTAIAGMETVTPFNFILTPKQMDEYTVQQWYVGTLAQVVAYVNRVDAGQNYQSGTLAWAQPFESHTEPGRYAVPKHPGFVDSEMELIQGELPAGWFPEIEN